MRVKLLAIVILTLLLFVGLAQAQGGVVRVSPTDPGWDPQAGAVAQPETPGGILAATVWVDDDTYDVATCIAAGHTWGTDCTNTVQGGISLVDAGGTIYVAAGTYVETGQIAIAKNLSIVGEARATTIIKPNQNTGNSGDARGWWLVASGYTFNLSGVTLDGQGWDTYQAIRSSAGGTIDDVAIQNVIYPGSQGTGIVLFGNMTVSDSTFANMGRIGVIAFGAGSTTSIISGNTYTGKGNGTWLDYGVEVGGGAQATISGNTFSGNTGVASDGSISAGILVTTYYGAGTVATITGNILTNNIDGVAIGYGTTDTSVVVAHDNSIYANTNYGIGSTTGPSVDASGNWWGSADAATVKAAANDGSVVDYTPWLASGTNSAPAPGFHGDFSVLWVDDDSPQTGTTGRIQEGVNLVSGSTVYVAAGTYVENVWVDKPLEMIGAGAATTTIYPAVSLPNPCSGSSLCGSRTAASNIILTEASDITIHGFTLDGDNPGLTSGIVRGGADLDARNGIIEYGTAGVFDNLVVYDTTVKNIYLRGIYANSYGSGFYLHHNTVQNVQGDENSIAIFNFGGSGQIVSNTVSDANDAIAANHSRGTQFLNNIVTNSGSGVHTDNNGSMGGTADLIQGNNVTCPGVGYGVWVFYPYRAATLDQNTVTGCDVGLSAWGQGAAVTALFTNNTVTGPSKSAGSAGAYITTDTIGWGYTDVSVELRNNLITDFETAVYLTADAQSWNPGPYEAKTIYSVFYDNSLGGNTYGMDMGTNGTYNADASANWWGSADPAAVKAAANGGSIVDYTPWLAVGTDTGDPGFRGSFSTLWVDDDSPQTGTTGRIREGVALVTAGGTVHAAAGTYAEDLVIDKPVSLLCPNVGIDPNTGARVPEAIIMPATEGSTTWGMIVDLQASNVIIDGCLLDGDNPFLTGGTPLGTADVNTNAAIDNGGYYQVDHLVVQNNIIQNLLYSSIYLDTAYGVNHSGNYIVHNLFDNMWEGIQIYAAETDISDNVFNNVTRGVSYHQVSVAADPGFTPQIANNTVNVVYNWDDTDRNVAIFVNGRQGSAAPFSIVGNTVNTPNATPSGKEYWGFTLWAVTGDRVVSFSGNTVNGGGNCDIGLWAWYIDSSNPVVLGSGGGLYGIKDTGVLLTNYHNTWGAGNTALTLSGLPITVSSGGTLVRAWEGTTEPTGGLLEPLRNGRSLPAPDRTGIEANDTTLTITGGTYSGGAIGIDVDGATAAVSGATISTNGTGVYIHNGGAGTFTDNCIEDNTSYGMNNTTGVAVSAGFSWWGDGTGPYHATNPSGLGDIVSDDVAFAPWISDMCHGTATAGHWLNLRTGVYSTLAFAVAAAAPGDTIQGTCPDGLPIPGGGTATVDNVTVDLNGCTAGPGPSFLIVNADDVTVLGPGVIDGWDGSANSPDPAIRVLAGADNFSLKGAEVLRWASGVFLEGSVLSFKMAENFIHNNTGAGLVVGSGVTLSGIVTIEGNLFKDNGGPGIQQDGSGALPAAYNSWGDLAGPAGPLGDGVGGSVAYIPWTFAEIFLDMAPDTEAVVRHVAETTSFDIELKADAAKLYGVAFRFSYDTAKLTLNSTTFAAPWAGRCTVLPLLAPDEIGYFCSLLNEVPPDPEWDADGGTIATFSFTAFSGTPGNGPWTALFDISHLEIDTQASAIGGQKVFINNAGFNAPSIPARDITDEDDGQVIIERVANYTGLVDLQGRMSDGLAVCRVYNQPAKAGAVELARGTSAASGAYTTAHIAPNWLAYGSTYYIVIDRWLFLTTTPLSEPTFRHSRLLDTTPLTSLPTVFLLGGDATNDEIILIDDLSCIGGDYGKTSGFTVCGVNGLSDVNQDGSVNIQDLSLAGGNFYKTFSPWTVP